MDETVLIVDDHTGFRSRARKLLEADGFRVSEASDGESAIESIASDTPELVLLDIQLPGADGFEVARRLAAGGGKPTVVLTSSRDAVDYGRLLAGAPVAGFVAKAELSARRLRSFLTTDR